MDLATSPEIISKVIQASESTLAIRDYVASKDKDSLKAAGGRVGLCVSKVVHEKLWPEASNWILSN